MSEAQHEKLVAEVSRLEAELEVVRSCKNTGEVCEIIINMTGKRGAN